MIELVSILKDHGSALCILNGGNGVLIFPVEVRCGQFGDIRRENLRTVKEPQTSPERGHHTGSRGLSCSRMSDYQAVEHNTVRAQSGFFPLLFNAAADRGFFHPFFEVPPSGKASYDRQAVPRRGTAADYCLRVRSRELKRPRTENLYMLACHEFPLSENRENQSVLFIILQDIIVPEQDIRHKRRNMKQPVALICAISILSNS